MNPRSTNRTLIVVLIALLAANLVFGFFQFGKKAKPDDRHGQLREYLKNEVKFSPSQLAAYDSLQTDHKRTTKTMIDGLRNFKKENMKAMGRAGFTNGAIDSAIGLSAAEQEKMESHMLHHIQQVRNLCTAEQKAVFDTGVYKAFERAPRQ